MSDYITNTLIALVICVAALVCGIGISTTLSTSAKAETVSIDESMNQLEKLYNELQAFNKTPHYLENGYSAAGQGDWADEVLKLDKDVALKAYVETIAPEKILFTWPFHSLQTLRPYHLWVSGRVYHRNGGEETEDTRVVKAAFEELFKLHKSRKK